MNNQTRLVKIGKKWPDIYFVDPSAVRGVVYCEEEEAVFVHVQGLILNIIRVPVDYGRASHISMALVERCVREIAGAINAEIDLANHVAPKNPKRKRKAAR